MPFLSPLDASECCASPINFSRGLGSKSAPALGSLQSFTQTGCSQALKVRGHSLQLLAEDEHLDSARCQPFAWTIELGQGHYTWKGPYSCASDVVHGL